MKRLTIITLVAAAVAVGVFTDPRPARNRTDELTHTQIEVSYEPITVPDFTLAPQRSTDPPMPSSDEIERMIRRVEADGFHVRGEGQSLHASNGRHGFSAQWSLDEGQLRVESLDPGEIWHFAMRTPGVVRDSEIEGGKLTLKRDAMDEWFINDSKGIEHGFDVAEPPARSGDGGFTVGMEVVTSLVPELHPDQRSITFRGPEDEETLFYRGLLVFDADGRSLPASMEIASADASSSNWELAIHVDDRGARYPLVIDPLISTRTDGLSSPTASQSERFGSAVSMSGNLLAVGLASANGPDPGLDDIGAVDLFLYDEILKSWGHEKRFYPGNPIGDSWFGSSLKLRGNYLIVGAPDDDEERGAAYVYERDAGGPDNWGEVAKLVAPDGQPFASFGSSVAIDEGVAAIGADNHDGVASNTGALYVSFRDPVGNWSTPGHVTGYDPAADDHYGTAVDVDGNRIVGSARWGQTGATPADVGVVAVHDYVFDENGAPVSHSTEFVVDTNPSPSASFGKSVELEGDTLIVGSPNTTTAAGPNAGTVDIFRYDPMAGWAWVNELQAADGQSGAGFGDALSFSGATLAVGAPFYNFSAAFPNSGAVYLFEKAVGTGDDWRFVELAFGSSQQVESRFASAVTVSGDAIAIGNPLRETAAGSKAGRVETLERRSTEWHLVTSQSSTLQIDAEHGYSVSIDRSQVAVGTPRREEGGEERGAVTVSSVLIGGEEGWGTEETLLSPIPQLDERFGHSVALAGSWLLVGAPGHNGTGADNAGRAYLFRNDGGTGWHHHTTLSVAELPADAEFGMAVALNSRWAFVGAPGNDRGYIFDRHEGGSDNWGLAATLDESPDGGRFGSAVAVDGEYVVFSAPDRDGVAPPGEMPPVVQGAGQVMIYRATQVGTDAVWQEVKTLPELEPDGSFGALGGAFGSSLALDHGVLLAGEPGYLGGTGRVKAFGLNEGGAGNWGELQSLDPASPMPGDRFGEAVGVGMRWFFVGAPGQQEGGLETGSVHVYDRNKLPEPSPPQADSVILHPYSGDGARFGAALAILNNELVVGSPGMSNKLGGSGTGNIAIYHRQSSGWAPLGNPQGAIAAPGDMLGFSVAMDGDFLVAGAPFDVVNGNLSAGSVHLYRRNPAVEAGWSYVKKLLAVDFQTGANFGYSVDIHGDTAVIGAPGWDNRGAAYVFGRNVGGADNWGQQKRIDQFLINNGDEFGRAVAVDGGLIAVGVPNDNVDGKLDAGTVYLYGRYASFGSAWGLVTAIHEDNPEAFNFFGSAVDVDDGRVLIGAPLADAPGDASGVGYVYALPPGGGAWSLIDTLNLFSAANNRRGGSVAIDGDTCVLGAAGDDEFAMGSGSVAVFRESSGDGSQWTYDERVTAGQFENPAFQLNVGFGKSVAMKGDQMVVGAPGLDSGNINVGAAYVIERNQSGSTKWGMVRRLVGTPAGAVAMAGTAVAMTDDTVVAGAPEADQGAQVDAGYLLFFGDVSSMNEDWLRAHFGDADVDDPALEATVWGPEADPDEDGLVNALEAFMSTDPQLKDSLADLMGIGRDPGGDLVFTYVMGKETHGVVGRVKWSRDLIEWRGGEPGPEEFEIATRVAREYPNHFMMEARISAAQLVGEPRLWMRLEVHVP